ncbi:enoyl-CoA hydratase-related protein [Methylocystis bryophila]|uniref:Enoyl-CoA hydratase n=1 Tax=Methylocystis bryophila TaxID=655015 RepID=A0A1W6N1P1_9HYPH|nr:enoyl-CoA hydratase-related protein [Methylocystis bryophila]ARN83726.1 enoyl-CoA hydratase [Methylocystis bryophila]BDV38574.1 gamma-carboxygeranoyl-CoA hydratase [Methylocystis bryophila]
MSDLLLSSDLRGVATLTLDRPERHNAFDDALVASLTAALRQLAENEGVRLLVVRGAGRSFSAGGDIEWLRRMGGASFEENVGDAQALGRMMRLLDSFPKPTIAFVHGAAYGGGVGLVACCDIAIATERASFCLSEARLGIIPAAVGPFVIRAIGARQARRLMMTAEVFSAAAAREIGLVHEAPPEHAAEEALSRIVEALLRCAPGAQKHAKAFISHCASRAIDDELMQEAARILATLRCSAEGREGLSAFLEKRAPRWIGGGSDADVSQAADR